MNEVELVKFKYFDKFDHIGYFDSDYLVDLVGSCRRFLVGLIVH